MLFINNKSTDIYFNLAVEEYLLKNYPEDIFMLWQDNNAVVLGKYQNASAEIDLDFAAKHHINIARRYSGGGTVYHDSGNINLTFIETTDSINFDKYIRQILDFLSSVGIHAWVDERRSIYINQSKISGSAQCVYKGRVVFHCTLLYSTNLSTLRSVLNGNPEHTEEMPNSNKYTRAVKSVKSEVTNLCSLLPYPLGIDDLKTRLLDFFLKKNSENRVYNLSRDDLKAITQLRNEKYATQEWILSRCVKTVINQLAI